MSSLPATPSRRGILVLACAFELGLAAAALLLGWLLGVDVLACLRVGLEPTLWGVAACAPLLAALPWWLRTRWAPLASIRELLETSFLPLFDRSRVVDVALIAAAAGFGEELLFRGLLQAGLDGAVGAVPALFLASAVFGLAHAVSRAYAVLAALIGAYLGALFLWTGELWPPMLAHGVYDLVALAALIRRRRARATSAPA